MSLESKIVKANEYIDIGYSPSEAADMAGITVAEFDNVQVDDKLGGDGKFSTLDFFGLENEESAESVVSYDVVETYVSGGGSTQLGQATYESTPESEQLRSEADALEAERKALLAEKIAIGKAAGLTKGQALREAAGDEEVQALGTASLEAGIASDAARTEIPGTITYYDPNGVEITEAEYNTIPGAKQHIVGTTTGVASADDPTVAQLEANAAGPVELTEEQANEAIIAANIENHNERLAEGQRVAEDANDWRVRLHLADSADYLYKSNDPGILEPLKETNGVIFPYTPEIAVQYNADYENYDLVHSNYRGYFYKGSQVQNLLITATFTANDVNEANYMLATLHFLRSCTKMFYGQDQNRGMPPPVVFLTGLGEYQFNHHPCAVTMMNYNLPNDVDYIPCGKPEGVAPEATPRGVPTTGAARLKSTGLGPGGLPLRERGDASNNFGYTKVYNKATYVPTKIDINFTMIPIQTREQISNEFSLENYANGSLLKKGFW